VQSSFADADLVLIGHGSTLNRESAAPVIEHAAELRGRRCFESVREAFCKQEPRIRAVLAATTARRVFAVPLFVSDGYYTEQVIPIELGLDPTQGARAERVRQAGERTLFYCAPVGTHPSMTRVILARAREVVARNPSPWPPKPSETALFIAGHGTDRNENSRRAIERQAELIGALGTYGEVRAVFLEEAPRITEVYRLAQRQNVIVVPFFISDGLHSDQDIPVMLGEPERVVQERLQAGQPSWRNPTERQGKRLWYARSVGSEPHLPDVILERVREAATWVGLASHTVKSGGSNPATR
jgi:sirohydrochlorin cobaltochelatase